MVTYLELDLHDKKLKNVGTPGTGSDGFDRDYGDTRYLGKSAGGTVSGNTIFTGTVDIYDYLDMNGYRINNLANPVSLYDAANKLYVDTHTFTSFQNWVADDNLDMDNYDIRNVEDCEIEDDLRVDNIRADAINIDIYDDIEIRADIIPEVNDTRDIGADGIEFKEIHCETLTETGDHVYGERSCILCEKSFKEGEALVSYALSNTKEGVRTVQVHLGCAIKPENQTKKKRDKSIEVLKKQGRYIDPIKVIKRQKEKYKKIMERRKLKEAYKKMSREERQKIRQAKKELKLKK